MSKQRASKVASILAVLAVVLAAGCVGQVYEGGFPGLGNISERYNQSLQNLEEYYERQRNMTFDVELEYGESFRGVPEITLHSDGKLKTTFKVTVTSDSNESASISVRIKDINTGWENDPSSSGSRNFRKTDTYYIQAYEFPELGYIPEFEVCISQFFANDYKYHCFNETLPPADLSVEFSPSPIEIELSGRETKEVEITLSNNGIFWINTGDFYFEEPEDPRFRITISTDASSLFPGQSAPATVRVASFVDEPFEFSGEAYFVQFRDNLGNYIYKKTFTIIVRHG